MRDELNTHYSTLLNVYKELGYDESVIGQWTLPLPDAQKLAGIIQSRIPHNILEVGTFVGLTTLLMALISPPETHIHTIDPNFPLEVEMGSMKCKTDNSDTSIKAQELALKAAKCLGVEHKITFHAGGFSTSNTFASYNQAPSSRIDIIGPEICKSYGPFDFIFIDGLHYEEDVFSDLKLAADHLLPSSSIAMHDVLGAWGSNVRRAVFRFLEKREDFIFFHGKYADICDSIGLLQHVNQKPREISKKNGLEIKNQGFIQDTMFSNLVAVLMHMFSPSSVLQIGGNIHLLKKLADSGVSQVCGLYPGDMQHDSIPLKKFIPHKKYQLDQTYDLCLCLGIAESFPEKLFDDIIQTCVEASNTIIFACTPPGELAHFHYNDKPLTYWIEKFFAKGYIFSDVIRPVLEPLFFSDIIHSGYRFNSSYLMNLYLVKKYNELNSDLVIKSFLKDILLEKERRIEDLSLQLLYKNNVLNYIKNKNEEYKKSERNFRDVIINQNEQMETINIFNKRVIKNTLRRIQEVFKKRFHK